VRPVLISLCLLLGTTAAAAAELNRAAIEEATFEAGTAIPASQRSPIAAKIQIFLDRAHISPGIIDGYFGENVESALRTFEERENLQPDGKLDKQTWEKLAAGSQEVFMEYEISQDDVSGPFVEAVPDDLRAMAEMDRLAYSGPEELLAEKFHMARELLRELNPDADFGKAGTRIVVAAVREPEPAGKVSRIEVDKAGKQVRGYDADGRLTVAYPATIGSEQNPSPSGKVEVKAKAPNPVYYYRPDETFRIDGVDEPLDISAGPNNPVGSVWIDLDKEGYGIHGTPDPENIGKTYSHGCVRLTNWDAEELAGLVEKGIVVEFIGG
jgi:lipoprotein-anchoring transpeptidase ErfK/SrfK